MLRERFDYSSAGEAPDPKNYSQYLNTDFENSDGTEGTIPWPALEIQLGELQTCNTIVFFRTELR